MCDVLEIISNDFEGPGRLNDSLNAIDPAQNRPRDCLSDLKIPCLVRSCDVCSVILLAIDH